MPGVHNAILQIVSAPGNSDRSVGDVKALDSILTILQKDDSFQAKTQNNLKKIALL